MKFRTSITRATLLAAATCLVALTSATAPAWAEGRLTGTGFGFESASVTMEAVPGVPVSQAGSHPANLTVSFAFESAIESGVRKTVGGEPRLVNFTLPRGFVGNASAVPQCPPRDADVEKEEACPVDSEVGEAEVETGGLVLHLPVYNMVPAPGVPAQFSINLVGINALLNAEVGNRSEEYALKVANHFPEGRDVVFAKATIWGLAAEHVPGGANKPFLTLPSSCDGPLHWHFTADTWSEPSEWAETEVTTAGLTGCERLAFPTTLTVLPEVARADQPTGIDAELESPTEGLSETKMTSATNLADVTVTLPPGMTANPGQAATLGFCEPGQAMVDASDRPAECPPPSKLGTVEAATPLLSEHFHGSVYLLPSTPPSLEVMITLDGAGVHLKLLGYARLDEATGQLTATFPKAPDIPVSYFRLHFNGGASAPVVSPARCGNYSIGVQLEPWAAPYVDTAFQQNLFAISSGPAGESCPASLPFAPTVAAGGRSTHAGQYSSFALQLKRSDGEQNVSALQVTLPEGLSGSIANVPVCGEPQAEQGACPPESQLGTAIVSAGAGSQPLVLPQPGQPQIPVYLTGPYDGAPFGLSVRTPIVAGPFNLGTIVVRSRITVDPDTSQVTVTTDTSGPHAIPRIIDGVPVSIRDLTVNVTRARFMFNPTSCAAKSISTVVASNDGAASTSQTPFRVGGCAELPFAPKLTATTTGKTSKAKGASLHVKLIAPAEGPQTTTNGSSGLSTSSIAQTEEANIARVKVELPKILPAQLKTLQRACTSAQFDSNPAGCPPESIVGHAVAKTPVLGNPLSGPAYFVSHGNEAFPQLIVVLQGENITVDLVGDTFISKAGITSSTFAHVPDVPVTSFELTLPEGKYSALAANADLCKNVKKLTMPTEFVGQNGAKTNEMTKIVATGCPKAKKAEAKAEKRKKTRKS